MRYMWVGKMKSFCKEHQLLDCDCCDDPNRSGEEICEHDDIKWGEYGFGSSDFIEIDGKCKSCKIEIRETFTPSMRYYRTKQDKEWSNEEDISI